MDEDELKQVMAHIRANRRRDYEAAIIPALCFAAIICILIAEAFR